MSTTGHTQDAIGILISPLKKNKSADESAVNVFKLLKKLGLKHGDISRLYINPKFGLAKVELFQADCEDYLIKVLKEVRSIMSVFNLRKLVENPELMVVVRIKLIAHRLHHQVGT
jgi:predicted DNA-binding antitoxin AbrB/MazE fold protein